MEHAPKMLDISDAYSELCQTFKMDPEADLGLLSHLRWSAL